MSKTPKPNINKKCPVRDTMPIAQTAAERHGNVGAILAKQKEEHANTVFFDIDS